MAVKESGVFRMITREIPALMIILLHMEQGLALGTSSSVWASTPTQIQGGARHFAAGGVDDGVGLRVHRSAQLVPLPPGNPQLFPQADAQIAAVLPPPRRARVPGGQNLIVLDNDGAEIPAQTGAPAQHRLGDVQIIVFPIPSLHTQTPFPSRIACILPLHDTGFSARMQDHPAKRAVSPPFAPSERMTFMAVNSALLVATPGPPGCTPTVPIPASPWGRPCWLPPGRSTAASTAKAPPTGATICAERAALTAAVTAGETAFVALAVAAGEEPVPPCGVCRQLLAEFGDMAVICAAGEPGAQGDPLRETTLSALLPDAFTRRDLA